MEGDDLGGLRRGGLEGRAIVLELASDVETAAQVKEICLFVTDPRGQQRPMALAGTRAIIGRGEEVEVRLDDPRVSRRHAELSQDPFGRWWVRDLGSRNGTHVNGGVVKECVLHPADTLEVGGWRLRLSPPSAAMETISSDSGGLLAVQPDNTRISKLSDAEPPKLAAEHLFALAEFGKQLGLTPDSSERLRMLCRLMLGPQFHGFSAVAIRVRRGEPSRAPQLLCEPELAQGATRPYISASVVRAVLEGQQPVLAGNTAAGAGQIEMSIVSDALAVAVIACPLDAGSGDDLDLLYVTIPPQYGQSEWLALAALAVKQFEQTSAIWLNLARLQAHAAIENDLQKARRIQMRLVPKDLIIPGLELAIGFQPCRWIGGDYVDVIPLADGRVVLAVADVCGKGLPAALVASSVHTMVHASLTAGLGVPRMMANLNDYLCQTLPDQVFVTMLALCLDPRTGQIESVNAGHPPGLIVNERCSPRPLRLNRNLPLALMPGLLESENDVIEPGDLLALYTDGLTELANESGEMLAETGLAELLKSICPPVAGAAASAVPQAAEALTERLNAILGPRQPDDDRTFLLARRS